MAERLEIIISAKDQASGAIKGVTGALGNLGGTVLKGVAVGLGAAAVGLGAVGAAAFRLAADAAPLQGIQMAFEGLAESAGTSADAMLEALQKGSAGMVTNRDLMLSFNKAAQLVGKDFAVQLPEAMQYLGKVALATGQDMGYMMDSLVVGVGRMSPMILDNLGIQVKLSDATERAAQMFGVEESALTKAQQQAGMMNVVLEKLKENTEAMPDVTESAAQKFESFKTTLQNTKDQIGLALLPVVTPLMEKLGALAADILPKLVAAIVPFLERLGNLVSVLLNAGFASQAFRDALSDMVGADIANFIIGMVEAISNLANTIITFVRDHWEAFKTALIAVGAILAAGAIVAGIAAIVGIITSLLNPIGLIIVIIGVLAAAWATNWGGIQEKTSAVLNAIKSVINSALNAIKGFWDKHGAQIMAVAQKAWNAIQSIINAVLNIIKSVFAAFKSAFEGDWRAFGENLRSAWDQAWRLIVSVLQSIGKTILSLMATLIANIIQKFKSTDWGAVGKNIINGIINGIKSLIGKLVAAAKAAAQAAFNAIKGFFGIDSPSKLMANMGEDLMKGLALGITRGTEFPISAMTGSAEQVAGATVSTVNNWNLTINEAGTRGSVIQDFALMKALAGV